MKGCIAFLLLVVSLYANAEAQPQSVVKRTYAHESQPDAVLQPSEAACGKEENSRGCINGSKITSDDLDRAAASAPTYPVVPTVFPTVTYIPH